jgi:molybdopterin synthase catalytic subunit
MIETDIINAKSTSISNPYQDDRIWIQVSEQIPSLEECYRFVASDPSCGAVSTFVGITRDNFQGKQVQKLWYEAYVPMAVKVLLEICHEALSFEEEGGSSVSRIAAVHIVGDCPVGNASVVLACSSPHRQQSIRCCEYLINQLKARVPIWKLEVYEEEDGCVWKENVEWKEGKQHRVMVKIDSNKQPDQTNHE